jgi:spore coat polysaccharide biosynthesis protein SpsF
MIATIIQARMGSTRLPGKSAMLLAGKPLLWHVLRRVSQATLVGAIVLAIPKETQSQILVDIATSLNVPTAIVDGDPNDLLLRYSLVAQYVDADTIVRIPADNPCVDPDEIDRIIERSKIAYWNQMTSNLDRNLCDNGYPGGLGAEVYSRKYLDWLNEHVDLLRHREHPHITAIRNGQVLTVEFPYGKYPDLRFDVNTIQDFKYIETIFHALGSNFRTKDILGYLNGKCH